MSLFDRKRNSLDDLLNRPKPSLWQQFIAQPCIFLARKLYIWQQPIPAKPLTKPVSVVCISDTHNSQPKLPDGDILLHAGDLTQSGTFKELQATLAWLRAQPHLIKIVVAGNHDLLLDANHMVLKSDATINKSQTESQRTSLDWGDIIY